jgi:hypothetical protein
MQLLENNSHRSKRTSQCMTLQYKNNFNLALIFIKTAAPTPPTDILGTLSCRHAVMGSFGFAICTPANIIMGDEIFLVHYILFSLSILANTISLLFAFFAGRAVNAVAVPVGSSLSAHASLSFAIAFPRAFAATLFLSVVAGLGAFAGGDIKAQSEPGDVDLHSVVRNCYLHVFGSSILSLPPCSDSQNSLACNFWSVPRLPDREVEEGNEDLSYCQCSCLPPGSPLHLTSIPAATNFIYGI